MNGLWEFFQNTFQIIYLQSSDNFRKWNQNQEKKTCFFPEEKPLSFFKLYSQDNCLLECKLKKVTKKCQCMPWYLKQHGLEICTNQGNKCLETELLR